VSRETARQRLWRPVVVLLAAIFAALAFIVGNQPVYYDSATYSLLGFQLIERGFPAVASDPLRTYGYPLFVALCALPTQATVYNDGRIQVAAAIGQFVALVGVTWFHADRVGRAIRSVRMRDATFVLTILNPFLLASGAATMSDGLSAMMITLAVALCLPVPAAPRWRSATCAASLFVAGYAAIIRPSNAFLIPLLLALWIGRATWSRDVNWHVLLIAAVCSVLPILPQPIANYQLRGQFIEPRQQGLYAEQLAWGTQYLKYVTLAVEPPEIPEKRVSPRAIYQNPSQPSQPAWLTFVREQPAWALSVVALHLFALADQDFLFTYVRDISPWYRWPLSTVNYVLLVLAAVGGPLLLADAWKCRRLMLAVTAPMVVLLAYMSVYALTAVEARFGLPIFLLLAPAMARGMLALPDLARRWRVGVPLAIAAIAAVLVCGSVSAWMQEQSPGILQARTLRAESIVNDR
jgi:hypothetical protein